MEDGDVGEDEVEDVRDEALIDEYANRLTQITQRASAEETSGESTEEPAETGRGEETASGQTDGPQPSTREAQQQHQRELPQQAEQSQQAGQPQQAEQPQQTGQPHRAGQPTQSTPQQQARAQPRRQPSSQQYRQQQRQYRQTGEAPQQQSRREFSTVERETVSVEELRELDELLATYEDEARFEIRNLPRRHSTEAVGKLFVAQEARSLLRDVVGGGQETQSQ